MKTAIVILAAGQGTRMKSSLPKVLHKLGGKTLLNHVIDTARQVTDHLVVVTGHGSTLVRESVEETAVKFVEQQHQLGTGHAVTQALPVITDADLVVVLYGDVPLIQKATLDTLIEDIDENTLGLLTVELPDPTGYGRIVRDKAGNVLEIVEQKDASPQQREISEVNTGIMAIPAGLLGKWLPNLQNNNAQGEYYLTDLIAMAKREGVTIKTLLHTNIRELEGVNDRIQLAAMERYYQSQQAKQIMLQGNTLMDPDRFDCRGQLQTGTDNSIDINCIFEGKVTLGSRIHIGPNCLLKNCDIGDDVIIKSNSVIEGAKVAAECEIGPFARVRPGTELSEQSKVGNFVETKNARVGKGSKINHLSYVGDAILGKDVNVGAGTITCNYDGANKHTTEIGDNAFIGSNSALVAPVTIGKSATIGAGSTIAKQVKDKSLALTRARQVEISDWKRPVKK